MRNHQFVAKSPSAVDLPRDEGKVADGEAGTRFDCLTDEADTQSSRSGVDVRTCIPRLLAPGTAGLAPGAARQESGFPAPFPRSLFCSFFSRKGGEVWREGTLFLHFASRNKHSCRGRCSHNHSPSVGTGHRPARKGGFPLPPET